MKFTDRALQRWRIDLAAPHIPIGARVLDVGCGDGALLLRLGSRIREGLGIDPKLDREVNLGTIRLEPGRLPGSLGNRGTFDAITMLAVLEHVPRAEQADLARACARLLEPGGRLIVTVPSPVVDRLLPVLKRMRLVDGMAFEEHYGFDVRTTPAVFTPHGFALIVRRRFQLGLNNLFVFRRVGSAESAA